jgi:hypothetical protein
MTQACVRLCFLFLFITGIGGCPAWAQAQGVEPDAEAAPEPEGPAAAGDQVGQTGLLVPPIGMTTVIIESEGRLQVVIDPLGPCEACQIPRPVLDFPTKDTTVIIPNGEYELITVVKPGLSDSFGLTARGGTQKWTVSGGYKDRSRHGVPWIVGGVLLVAAAFSAYAMEDFGASMECHDPSVDCWSSGPTDHSVSFLLGAGGVGMIIAGAYKVSKSNGQAEVEVR